MVDQAIICASDIVNRYCTHAYIKFDFFSSFIVNQLVVRAVISYTSCQGFDFVPPRVSALLINEMN
jgi:hypothetical protein